ncbi:hypothetical protein ACFOYW_16685 [Gryllotalpicola reticulitermitis]|uniref:Uncharacterized protein n=1 Tax=Gryllotalpicola reticulitermitis TaxID=1184153 RepID=A0ABV8QC07_9MICO
MTVQRVDISRLPRQEMEVFATSEGLRSVLQVIAACGETGWRSLPIAQDLMLYAAHRYEPLAASWHREPWEAAAAAFLAMRTAAILHARDPWAMVTVAVERDLRLETAAEREITSRNRIKHDGIRPERVPVRAGEWEEYLFDTLHSPAPEREEKALDDVIHVPAAYLTRAGWDPEDAIAVVEYMCGRITDLGSLDSAVDTLQRDRAMRELLGLPPRCWSALIHTLIGTHSTAKRPARIGAIPRVLAGAALPELLLDEALTQEASASTPQYCAAGV